MREKPAVVYPASEVDSVVVRADMESASLQRQSMQTAGVMLPEMLSASSGVGASQCAMMGDQSLRKGGWVKRRSSRHRVSRVVQFLSNPRHVSSIDFSVTQGGVANPGQLVGQSACCFVVVGVTFHPNGATDFRRNGATLTGRFSGLERG